MRRIALITTSRAEYGIQSRLIRMLQDDCDVDFRLVVSGSHLSEKHGMTWRHIEADGIAIAEKVDIGIEDTNSVAHIMATALEKFSDVLAGMKPDLVVLLGDRYEMLSAALACTINNIPIAHIHGGETTMGAIDEVFRHSITKASYLHFTSCEEYRRRVIQLGEHPSRVFNVGSLGVENCRKFKLMAKRELEDSLGFKLGRRNVVVTFHPVTFERGSAVRQVDELLEALDRIQDAEVVITHPNADAEGDAIAERFKDFAERCQNVHLFASLGACRYLSLVKYCDAVIGNSSSGIIEVPSFGVPTVNIGNRQKGRIMASSVICCEPVRDKIHAAIKKAFSPRFVAQIKDIKNPYDKRGTVAAILHHLKSCRLDGACEKKFHDIV